MVLKTLVDAISQSLRDPHNLLHIQLVSSLKRSISQDITEAFTESQPLVDKYPDLYRESTSFLDFLFKICSAPNPPTPRESNGRDSERYKHELADRDTEIKGLNNILMQKDLSINELNQNLQECQRQLELKEQDASLFQAQLNVCQKQLQQLSNKHLESPVPAIQEQSADAIVTLPAECQAEALPSTLNPLPLEYSTTDSSEAKLKEWHDKLYGFLNDFKSEMGEKFKISEENNTKLNELLKEHFPNKDPTPVPTESLGSVDAFSENLFAKLEEFLTRYLNEEQLVESLKLFDLDKLFTDLKNDVVTQINKLEVKSVTYCKGQVIAEIGKTQKKLQDVLKGLIQKMSTMSSSKLTHISLLEKLDKLEQNLFYKSTELERLLEKTSTATKGGLQSDLQDLTQKFTVKESELGKVLSQKTDDLKKSIDAQTNAFQNNLSALQTPPYNDQMTDSQTQYLLKNDQSSVIKNAFSLLEYVKSQFPDIGYKQNWGDEVMTVLSDFKNTKLYMRNILSKFNQFHRSDKRLLDVSNYIIDSLLKSFFAATEKVNQIYATMESITGTNPQYLMHQTGTTDENFFQQLFQYIREVQLQMQNTQLKLTEAEYIKMQDSLPLISDHSGENFTIEECVEGMENETLAVRDTLTNDQLQLDRDDLKSQLSELQANLILTETRYNLQNKFRISLGNALDLPSSDPNWDNHVLDRINLMLDQINKLRDKNGRLTHKISDLDKQLADTNVQLKEYEEKVKSQESAIQENELVTKKLRVEQQTWENKYNEHEIELVRIQKDCNAKISEFKSQLNKESEKLTQTPKRKRIALEPTHGTNDEDTVFDKKNEASSKLMKQLFLVFYERYFKILYQHKWASLDDVKTVLREEIGEKLKFVGQIHQNLKQSELIDILLNYVKYEFQVLTEDGTPHIMEKDVEDVYYLEDLMTKAVNDTTSTIQRLLITRVPDTSQLQMEVCKQTVR